MDWPTDPTWKVRLSAGPPVKQGFFFSWPKGKLGRCNQYQPTSSFRGIPVFTCTKSYHIGYILFERMHAYIAQVSLGLKKQLFGCPPLPAPNFEKLESFYCTKVYCP